MSQNREPRIDSATYGNSVRDENPSHISKENTALQISDVGTTGESCGKR